MWQLSETQLVGNITTNTNIYWLNTRPTKALQLVNNIRPGDNNICHIIIGSVTSEPTQKFYWLNIRPTKVLQLVNDIRPGDNSICHIIINYIQ